MKISLVMKFWDDGIKNSSRIINVKYTWKKLKLLTEFLQKNNVDCECELYDFSPEKIIEDSIHIPFGLSEYKISEKQNIILNRKNNSDYLFCFDCDAFFDENDYPNILNLLNSISKNQAYTFDMAKLDANSTLNVIHEKYDITTLEYNYAFTGDKKYGPFGLGHIGGLGGVYLVDIEMITKIGGFNEKYIGWGGEDNEVIDEIMKIGSVFPIKNFFPYHLEHYVDWGNKLYSNRFPIYTIGITTFSKRYDYIKKLIEQIRSYSNHKILVIINGEKNGNFNDEYRKDILKLCLSYCEIYPIFFIETRGLAKMWNTIVSHSNEENILMLGDDIEIITSDIFKITENHIRSKQYEGLTRINGSYAHFIINKKIIDELGYFDERLLGFGEEDGDITWRFIHKYKKQIGELQIGGITNIVSQIRHDHIKPGIGKYSLYNRKFMFEEKYVCGSEYEEYPIGMFGHPCKAILETQNALPYESYYMENKIKL